MPTPKDFSRGRRHPPAPAGGFRPGPGVINHQCLLALAAVCAAILHPWENLWVESDTRIRVDKDKPAPNSRQQRRHHRRERQKQASSEARAAFQARLLNAPNRIPDEHQADRCPCGPTIVRHDADGHPVHKVYHNRETCPYGPLAWEQPAFPNSGQLKIDHNPSPYRDPDLPKPLLAHVYQPLLDIKAHLVLAVYDPVNLRKRPIYSDWLTRRPDFPEIVEHLRREPNALIGIIPRSIGAVITDVDKGDGKAMAELLGSDITNATRRGQGMHIWTLAPLTGALPKDTGFEIPEKGVAGDTRCQKGYAILWNSKSVQNAIRIHQLGQERLRNPKSGGGYPEYPKKRMDRYKTVPKSWNGKPVDRESDEWKIRWHYAALYAAQDSAAWRDLLRIARTYEARRLHKRGWTVDRIADWQGVETKEVNRFLNRPIQKYRHLFTDELRRLANPSWRKPATRTEPAEPRRQANPDRPQTLAIILAAAMPLATLPRPAGHLWAYALSADRGPNRITPPSLDAQFSGYTPNLPEKQPRPPPKGPL